MPLPRGSRSHMLRRRKRLNCGHAALILRIDVGGRQWLQHIRLLLAHSLFLGWLLWVLRLLLWLLLNLLRRHPKLSRILHAALWLLWHHLLGWLEELWLLLLLLLSRRLCGGECHRLLLWGACLKTGQRIESVYLPSRDVLL